MNKIFNDDCLNILKQIPAETIDMVIHSENILLALLME